MNLEKKLIDGNFKFQWKLIKNQENIKVRDRIPRYPILILTCMDPRIDVLRIFQLEPGDAFILRNAGNIITNDVLRSILIAIYEYDVKYVIILGHIDCGMTKIKLERLKRKLKPEVIKLICRVGQNPLTELRSFFKPFVDEFNNIKKQIKKLEEFRGIPSDVEITGMIYDVDTGWVFENDMIRDLKFRENFGQKYQDLLYVKRLQFVDFIETHENQIVNSGALISKKGEGVKIEIKDGNETQNRFINKRAHDTQNNQELELKEISLFEFPKVKVPKVILPKISVHIPKIYKRNKQESDI